MARQYKIEIDYPSGPNAQLYWHDNSTIEFVTLPQQTSSTSLRNRANLLEQIMNFIKVEKIVSVEITKLPTAELS